MKRLVVCMVIATMLLSMGALFAQEGLEQEECWYDRVCISGYYQFRFESVDGEGSDNFDFRRMFLTIQGDFDDRTAGVITLSRVGPDDPNIDLYNAFVNYAINERYAIQVGQVPTWFGLEAWEGSSVRLPFERAKILEGGPGFFFAGASDRGIWVRRTPEGAEPLAILGVWNGQFRTDDANDDKNVSIDLKWNRDWGQFGVSWFDGEYYNAASDLTQDRNAWDVYVRKFAQPWGFQAEYADGELLGADRDGWYVQGMYDFEDDQNTAYARYQEYTAEMGTASMEYDAVTLGVQHKLDQANFLTLEYTDGDWDNASEGSSSSSNEDVLGIQWQYNFR